MLALSTRCGDRGQPLDAIVGSFRPLGVRAVALHRVPTTDEVAGLAPLARLVKFVALFGEENPIGAPLLVVDGGEAAGDRHASLEALCRRLHRLKDWRVALRTPAGPDDHPAPDEIALVHEALPFVGYWHDADRSGAAHLEAAGRLLLGASFHPLGTVDLAGLREALPAAAPAVVACPPDEAAEALRCAQGYFR